MERAQFALGTIGTKLCYSLSIGGPWHAGACVPVPECEQPFSDRAADKVRRLGDRLAVARGDYVVREAPAG